MMELDWLKRWDQYAGDSIALMDGDTGRALDYSGFFENAQKTATLLKTSYGIKGGDRVALLAQNELESLVLFFALQRLAAILVPINFRLTRREIDHILDDSGAQLIIYQDDFLPQIEHRTEKRENFSHFAELAERVTERHMTFQAAEEDPCMILYTSGTTGSPKGAILTLRMIFWNSLNTTMRLNLSQNDVAVTFLPLFHTAGWNVLTTPFLHRGAKIVLLKKFEAEKVLQLTSEQNCTLLFGVPTTMDMMAQTPAFNEVDLSKVRYAIVGGEPMPVPLIEVWSKKGISIRQGYGLTEFGPNVFSLNEEDAIHKIGSIGFPNFYIETKVVNDEGKALGDNEVGELALRGPSMMSGYWKNEKATAETIRDGWLYTGDLVRRDTEGYFYVVGRKKDMFISGGENVYPPEIEQVLRRNPGVREVAVIGVPDEKWGEVGCAFVVKAEDLNPDQLRSYCLENLAKFKVPKHFEFVKELPKGDSGKILKRALKDGYQARPLV